MAGHLIAIALLAEIGILAYLQVRFHQRPLARWRIPVLLLIFAAAFIVMIPSYLDHTGVPWQTVCIALFTLSFALVMPLRNWSLNMAQLTVTLLISLCVLGTVKMLGDHGYIFRPDTQKFITSSLSSYVTETNPNTSYLAGWLVDLPFVSSMPKGITTNSIRVPHREWHSAFTGIYRLERIPGEVWFTGGTADHIMRKVELRPQPANRRYLIPNSR